MRGTLQQGDYPSPGIGWTGKAWAGQKLSNEEKKSVENEAECDAASEYSISDRENNSAMVFKQIANTILPKSIRMVEDTPHNHSNGYLPILDTEMKVANGRFTHRHYAKPMASVEVVNAKSAMSLGSKVAILTQEGNRTLRNCDPNMLWSEKVPYLNKLMISMLWSGYSEKN